MAEAVSISLAKFTASVQSAVKAAVAKHPKFKMDPPDAVTMSYLIRGIPLQSFATEIATHIAGAHPEMFAAAGRGAGTEGAILSIGRHLIVGIPPVVQTIRLKE